MNTSHFFSKTLFTVLSAALLLLPDLSLDGQFLIMMYSDLITLLKPIRQPIFRLNLY